VPRQTAFALRTIQASICESQEIVFFQATMSV